jgi:hypothetical protein
VTVGVAVLSNPALWNGTSVPKTFVEPARTAYQHRAAMALDGAGTSTVLAVPGQPFASTFAGTTVDPLWPGLLSRPFVTREQQVLGSLPTEDLLYAVDDPVQTGTADPAALAPMARLMGVGDLLLQDDLAFTRYGQPDPAVLWSALASSAPGLGAPQPFGPTRPAQNRRSKVADEQTYTLAPGVPAVPALAVLPVTQPRPLVRAEPAPAPLVVDGDAVGLEDLAGTGLLGGDPTVLYAGTLDTQSAARRSALSAGATLVVTDTNRRQPFRWDNLQDVAGPTLGAGEAQPADPSDHPLDIFPGAPSEAQTTTTLRGVVSVSASGSANPFQYLPEDRAVEAVDGNIDTAWQVGPFLDPRGQWWQVRLGAPMRTDNVTLVQPQTGRRNQWITAVTLRFDASAPQGVRLGPASRTAAGQRIEFPARSFRTLRVTIVDTSVPPRRALAGGLSSVGLAEVVFGAPVRAEERVVMPSDLLRATGPASQQDRLAFVMTRLRVAPATSRTDPEPALDRILWLPYPRTFALTGTARLDAQVPDDVVDQLTGRKGAAGRVVTATSTGRLQGDVADTASAALDGDPATAWTTPLGPGKQIGQSLTVQLPTDMTLDHLDLQVVVDGRHSVPSRLRVAGDHGSALVDLPRLPRQSEPDASDRVTVRIPPLETRTITVTILGIRPRRAADSYTGGRDTLPVAIAELGIPGVRVGPVASTLASSCRDDLVQIDGAAVWARVSGATEAALSGSGLPIVLCGPDAGGVVLGPGTHHVVATLGRASGFDVDQLVLDSAPWGPAQTGDAPGAVVPVPSAPAPSVRLVSHDTTSFRLELGPSSATRSSSDGSVWLVLGQSVNAGWQATVAGRSLGPPTLVDGFANGWLVPRSLLRHDAPVPVTLRWTPQGDVDVALVVSALSGAGCLGIVLWPRRRRGAARTGTSDEAPVGVALLGDDDAPTWWPDVDGAPLSWGHHIAVAIVAAVVAGIVAGLVVGVVVGIGVLVAGRMRHGRVVLAAAAIAAMVAVPVAMVVTEAVGGYPGDGQWPSHFEVAATLTWLALALVAAEGLLRWCRHGRGAAAGARRRGPRAFRQPWHPS